MDVKDFTEREQEQIKKGLSTAVLTDKEAAKKILALVPEEWIKTIPFLVRGHATTKTVQRIAKENPELYAVAKQEGELPEKEREELREIITGIFQQKMASRANLFAFRVVSLVVSCAAVVGSAVVDSLDSVLFLEI